MNELKAMIRNSYVEMISRDVRVNVKELYANTRDRLTVSIADAICKKFESAGDKPIFKNKEFNASIPISKLCDPEREDLYRGMGFSFVSDSGLHIRGRLVQTFYVMLHDIFNELGLKFNDYETFNRDDEEPTITFYFSMF
jgi:hypothetical protein